jgi:hypothetical protein
MESAKKFEARVNNFLKSTNGAKKVSLIVAYATIKVKAQITCFDANIPSWKDGMETTTDSLWLPTSIMASLLAKNSLDRDWKVICEFVRENPEQITSYLAGGQITYVQSKAEKGKPWEGLFSKVDKVENDSTYIEVVSLTLSRKNYEKAMDKLLAKAEEWMAKKAEITFNHARERENRLKGAYYEKRRRLFDDEDDD